MKFAAKEGEIEEEKKNEEGAYGHGLEATFEVEDVGGHDHDSAKLPIPSGQRHSKDKEPGTEENEAHDEDMTEHGGHEEDSSKETEEEDDIKVVLVSINLPTDPKGPLFCPCMAGVHLQMYSPRDRGRRGSDGGRGGDRSGSGPGRRGTGRTSSSVSARQSGTSSVPMHGGTAPSTSPPRPSTQSHTALSITTPTAAQLSLQNLRVNRRGAVPSVAPINARLTARQERDRIEAMRNLLRYPHGLERTIIVRHLMANNWDVNRAAEAFRREEQAVRDNPGVDWADDYQSDPSRTVGGSRLRAGHALRLQLRPTDPTGTTERFGRTNAEMFTLLQRNNWLVGATTSDFHAREGGFDDVIDGLATLRVPFPNQLQQDERLAAFITLTSTDSPSAAARLLRRVEWDYARAVDEWVNLGYVPKKSSETSAGSLSSLGKHVVARRRQIVANRHLKINRPVRPRTTGANQTSGNGSSSSSSDDSDSDNHRKGDVSSASEDGMSENESTVHLSDYDPTSEIDSEEFTKMPEMTYGTGRKDRRGYVIDLDRAPAKAGCPDASKLRIEWIRKGQYKCKWFPGQIKVGGKERKFRWNDSDHDSDNEKREFDWSDKSHVSKLNRWREEENRRITSEITKPGATKYEDAELEFIWDKHAEWLEEKFWKKARQRVNRGINRNSREYREARRQFASGMEEDLGKVPMATIKEWTREFNAKFAGKTVVDGHTFPAPRPSRAAPSIDIQRHRITNLEITNAEGAKVTLSTIEDFGVSHQPAHGRAPPPPTAAPTDSSSSSSDEEE